MQTPHSAAIKVLKRSALEAAKNSYSPYSRFPVGAAVLTDAGAIFAGCNVENSSYGLTICAERNAVFQAVAQGHRSIKTLVIVTDTETPTPPCGACRQVINEFGPKADIVSFGHGDIVRHWTADTLLPDSFGPDSTHKGSPKRKQTKGNRHEKY